MSVLKCRWCSDSFPIEFDDFLRSHVRLEHPVEHRLLQPYLKDVEIKLQSHETLANTISKGWNVYEPFDYKLFLEESDALTIVEALEADI